MPHIEFDPELKSIFDEILVERKRTHPYTKTVHKPPHKPEPPHEHYYDCYFAGTTAGTTIKSEEVKNPESFDQATSINTREETATLSLNTSKACIVLRAIYSDEVTTNIKESIDRKHRFWNERDRVWEFNPCVLKDLKALLMVLYADVQVVGVPKALPATKFDKLVAKLDKDDKTKIYRVLASKYHPDVKETGSHEVMTLLNEVFKQQ